MIMLTVNKVILILFLQYACFLFLFVIDLVCTSTITLIRSGETKIISCSQLCTRVVGEFNISTLSMVLAKGVL